MDNKTGDGSLETHASEVPIVGSAAKVNRKLPLEAQAGKYHSEATRAKDIDPLLGKNGAIDGDGIDSTAVATRKFYGQIGEHSDDDANDDDESHGIGRKRENIVEEGLDSMCAGGGCQIQ
mmetsp:Transcript_72186/g.145238  ORF Transcript_72186/g.145238 Transcript_72186/m.145238 type:complete len:120 (+) Transcript_72186:132-491(+)|eukprot:CAMPEP_0171624308 /NCGR_PEP_ID=MMETSP0990-20121206/18535_1 /TAXON_ID=483369 /ORGANISM="non described non described, Strain CCMP2098" /LENGTH=119 /DNA_ID=CAMNT_0012190819 /DNA_START=87 /DNA_END=446 /DNA_ORIENTATION=+